MTDTDRALSQARHDIARAADRIDAMVSRAMARADRLSRMGAR